MQATASVFSVEGLRRFFGGSNRALEHRVRALHVQTAQECHPNCPQCGFGTMRPIPVGQPQGGRLRCDRTGCSTITDNVVNLTAGHIVRI